MGDGKPIPVHLEIGALAATQSANIDVILGRAIHTMRGIRAISVPWLPLRIVVL